MVDYVGVNMPTQVNNRQENHVLAAYRAMRDNPLCYEQLEKSYLAAFGSISGLKPITREKFERFTMIDPNIRTVIQSNTTDY